MFTTGEKVRLSEEGLAILHSPDKSIFHRMVLSILEREPATVESIDAGGLVRIRFNRRIETLELDTCLIEESALKREKPVSD